MDTRRVEIFLNNHTLCSIWNLDPRLLSSVIQVPFFFIREILQEKEIFLNKEHKKWNEQFLKTNYFYPLFYISLFPYVLFEASFSDSIS